MAKKKVLKVFVVMPFSDTTHKENEKTMGISTKEWTFIYDEWIKPAIESYPKAGLEAKRSPAQSGNFVRGIIEDLEAADFIVADLTGRKPNVYYELGIRHALRTGTIIITQHLDAVPSDLGSYFAFEYQYTKHAHEKEELYNKFKTALHHQFDSFILGEVLSDSPVSDFLGPRSIEAEKIFLEEKNKIHSILKEFKKAQDYNFKISETLHRIYLKKETVEQPGLLEIDLFFFEALHLQIATQEWKMFPTSIMNGFNFFILKQRLFFSYLKHAIDVYEFNNSQKTLNAMIKSIEFIEDAARFEFEKGSSGAIEALKAYTLANAIEGKEIPELNI